MHSDKMLVELNVCAHISPVYIKYVMLVLMIFVEINVFHVSPLGVGIKTDSRRFRRISFLLYLVIVRKVYIRVIAAKSDVLKFPILLNTPLVSAVDFLIFVCYNDYIANKRASKWIILHICWNILQTEEI